MNFSTIFTFFAEIQSYIKKHKISTLSCTLSCRRSSRLTSRKSYRLEEQQILYLIGTTKKVFVFPSQKVSFSFSGTCFVKPINRESLFL